MLSRGVAAIQIIHKVRLLLLDGGQVRGRQYAAAQHFLLVVAIQHQNPWKQILQFLEQVFDFPAAIAFRLGKLLPGITRFA
jgi:hypothetical protein